MLGQAVDVISLCSASGEVSPLRLRVEDGAYGAHRVDIDRVMKRTPIEIVGAEGILFLCRATAGERQWTIELRYSLRTQTWHLLRRQDSFTTKTSSNTAMHP